MSECDRCDNTHTDQGGHYPTLPSPDEMTSLFSVALNTIGKCL